MAYSIIELNSLDLDIFFQDGSKIIHLASAGGLLPERLLNSDSYNENVLNIISNFNPEFEFEVNPNLIEILGINQDNLENYIGSFVEMAKRGFYSYDKSRLGDFEDLTFHLVARPKSPLKPHILFGRYDILEKVITSTSDLPFDFKSFNLSEHIQ